MLLKNPTTITVTVVSLGLTIPPGDTAEVEDGYCRSRRSVAGIPTESTMRLLAPQLVPADDTLGAEWSAKGGIEMDDEPTPAVTAEALERDGMAPGVAALVASGRTTAAPKQKRGR